MGYDKLNDMHIDALREIGNIGSGNAATALSTMLNKEIKIAVPTVKVLDYEEVVQDLGGPENVLIGILINLSGDISGMIMFLLEKEFAHMTLSHLIGSEFKEGVEMDPMSKSTMQEVGNIMAASYINAVASLTNFRINLSIPHMSVDMTGAMLSVPAIYYANIADRIILIEDKLDDRSNSRVLLIPEEDSLKNMMDALGL